MPLWNGNNNKKGEIKIYKNFVILLRNHFWWRQIIDRQREEIENQIKSNQINNKPKKKKNVNGKNINNNQYVSNVSTTSKLACRQKML